MCGIAGWVGARGADREVLDAMLKALEHRGPDDTGRHLDDDAALGMTRLAIIDLVTGRQPMTVDDGTATLVFNGEIYNYRDLRDELATRGRRFATRSDTEVLLRAWEEWGDACVERLHGMFAFAIWDARRRRLVLARDRLGKKPLYYWHRDGLPPLLEASRDVKVFLAPERDELRRRIDARFDTMLAGGARDEVRALAARRLDPLLPAMKAHGVPWLIRHLDGEITLAEAAEGAKNDTRRYTKRQFTWVRHQLPDWTWTAPEGALGDLLRAFSG